MHPISLDSAMFREQIFDFSAHEDWHFRGTRPAVIDFFAEWCGPCKALAPVIEELAIEYGNTVSFYTVDTDAESDLAALFSIQSIPTLLFIPLLGNPMIQQGALPKHILKKVIDERLLNADPK